MKRVNKKVFNNAIGESYSLTELDCGLKIYVLEKPEYNSSFALFGTKYGSIDTYFSLENGETITVPEGIAHFLEHKLFESEDGDAFSRFAQTGASANAFTSFDRTCYIFSCSERFYDNLNILLDFVQHPYFTEQNVQKEQGIIGQEIRMYDDNPNWCVFFNLLKGLYTSHPVRIDIAGTVESISDITPKLLYDCYNTFYDLSNMFLCIAGNVDTEKITEIVQKNLFNAKGKKARKEDFCEPKEVNSKYTESFLEVAMPLFSLGYKLDPDIINNSLKKRVSMGVALEILAGDSSELSKSLTERELINEEFETELFFGSGYSAVIFSGESCDPKKIADEIKKEISRLINCGFDTNLFEAVKRAMYGDTVRRFNNTEAIAMQLAECAMQNTDLFEELEIIRKISYDDVTECLKLLKEEFSSLSVVYPKK